MVNEDAFTATVTLDEAEAEMLKKVLNMTKYTGRFTGKTFTCDTHGIHYVCELTRKQVESFIARIDYYLSDVLQVEAVTDEQFDAQLENDKALQDEVMTASTLAVKLCNISVYERKQ